MTVESRLILFEIDRWEDKMNYQLELDKMLAEFDSMGIVPKLMLHSCCAPCSSYVIEYMAKHFDLTVFYYNPNISPRDEYNLRAREQRRLIREMDTKYPVKLVVGDYDAKNFFTAVKGLEKEPECGARCHICYEMRLQKTGELAKQLGSDYFATTLTISPMKKSQVLNDIGYKISKELEIEYLGTDFKKKSGNKRSTELSKEHNLYRQNFCGCIFSKIAMEAWEKEKALRVEQEDICQL